MPKTAVTVDEYIGQFPAGVQKGLNELRAFIKTHAPESCEKISYGMPTFYLNGNLLHFAAFKDHYSIFPAPSGSARLEKELAPYRSGKGTLRFPLDKPLPWKLLEKVIQFRVAENQKKAARFFSLAS